jgi:release factor glutamine methyltransferase
MRLIVLPGVFHPRSDTWQLARAACAEPLALRPRILELCAGPAAAGVAAARHHTGHLTTVDVSRRAVLNARLNAALYGVSARCRRGDLLAPVRGERFDLILANPPYLPGPTQPPRGAARAWNAGRDGRAVLDRICAEAPSFLTPRGVLLVVQSEVCGVDATLGAFATAGLAAAVADRQRGPLGPLLCARRRALEADGRLVAGQVAEEVLVLRGRAVPRPESEHHVSCH